jgi:hypothetical protein
MERKRSFARGALLLLVWALLFASVCPARAQSDYPLPAGNPDTWTTGRPERVFPENGQTPAQASPLSAPTPRGNEAQERPGAPAGEAEEVYTGKAQFGGIAGTGITQSGPLQNR